MILKLDLIKKGGFYLLECISGFNKVKEGLSNKEKFYSWLTGQELVINCMGMFLRFRIDLK